MSGLKICFVSPYAHALFTGRGGGYGGAEVQQRLIGRALAGRGFDIRFLSYAPGPPGEEVHEGVRFWTIPPPAASPLGRLLKLSSLKIWRSLGRPDADLRPFIFSVANDRDLDGRYVRAATPLQAALYRAGVRWASSVVVQTRCQEELLRERWNRQGVLIPSACALPSGPVPPAARREGVLWVGNLLPKKRPELVARLAAALPDIPFTMVAPRVGAPAYLWRVMGQIGAQSNVRHVERVSHREIDGFYRSAAVLVSTSSAEGFANVFLEAWANRLPVVSLDIDPDELICRRKLGEHARSVEEAAEAIKRLVGEVDEREEIGKRAQSYVQECHSPEAVASDYERLIRAMVGGSEG
jgi:glycosyltransferase involved in cell wall biosynthesis